MSVLSADVAQLEDIISDSNWYNQDFHNSVALHL